MRENYANQTLVNICEESEIENSQKQKLANEGYIPLWDSLASVAENSQNKKRISVNKASWKTLENARVKEHLQLGRK